MKDTNITKALANYAACGPVTPTGKQYAAQTLRNASAVGLGHLSSHERYAAKDRDCGYPYVRSIK